LVEWSTMLGDHKEVQAVGDPIRREGRGANVEDILLLHALHFPPPPPPAAHAIPSLTPFAAACLRPTAPIAPESLLRRALILSRADYMLNVRSDHGIAGMSENRRKEVARWFALAASGADGPLAALLFARAGAWETGRRRKGMWYALAGEPMDRYGLRRLATAYLSRAYGLLSQPSPPKLGELGEMDPSAARWLKKNKRTNDGFPIPDNIPRTLEKLTGEKLLEDEEEPEDPVDAEKALDRKERALVLSPEPMHEKEALTGAAVMGFWGRRVPTKEIQLDPLVVDVHVEEGEVITHDFGRLSGKPTPCKLHVTFTLRNVSDARTAEFTLRLPSAIAAATAAAAPLMPPQWTGALVHKGTIPPMQTCEERARLHISRSGQYALSGWRLDVRTGEDSFVQVGREGAVSVVQAEETAADV